MKARIGDKKRFSMIKEKKSMIMTLFRFVFSFFEMDRSFKLGLKKFITKAIPLTFVTAVIFLFAIYFLNNIYKLDEAIYKVIFIGLASLTFPHILLEYLLEKNEKRT